MTSSLFYLFFPYKLKVVDCVKQLNNLSQQTQNICIIFVQPPLIVFDVGPPLYKCCTKVLCLLGYLFFIEKILQCEILRRRTEY